MKKIALITLSILFFSSLILRSAKSQPIFKTMQESDLTDYSAAIIKAGFVNIIQPDKQDIPHTAEQRIIHYTTYPGSAGYAKTPAQPDLKPEADVSSVQCHEKLYDREETVKLEEWMLYPGKWLANK